METGLFILVACGVLAGCQEPEIATIAESQKKSSESQKKMDSQIAAMKSQLDDLEKSMTGLRLDINSDKSRYNSAIFDTSSKGYQRIDTTSGFFLLSLKDIQPYADGYRLKLDVGNPSSATYSGFSIRVTWSKSLQMAGYSEWEKAKHEKSVNYIEKLLPSSWNTVYLILTPAQRDDLGYIEISIETDVVELNIH
jgi:Protein of unknown function (DUF3251)